MSHYFMSRKQRAQLLQAALQEGASLQGVSTVNDEILPDLSIAMTEVVEDYPQLVERYDGAIALLRRSLVHNPTTPHSVTVESNLNAEITEFLAQEP